MSELKIQSIHTCGYTTTQQHTIKLNDKTHLDFKIKYDATPKEFIKHLRSMIWAIQKKVIENED